MQSLVGLVSKISGQWAGSAWRDEDRCSPWALEGSWNIWDIWYGVPDITKDGETEFAPWGKHSWVSMMV